MSQLHNWVQKMVEEKAAMMAVPMVVMMDTKEQKMVGMMDTKEQKMVVMMGEV